MPIPAYGGGYSQGSSKTHRELGARLARLTAMRIVTINYHLASEFLFPAAVEDAAAYRCLLASGLPAQSIVIAGDSAGGGLALAALLMLRDAGVPLPLATVLLLPWADLSLSGDSMQSRAALDPLVSRESLQAAAQHYLGAHDPRDPLVSPVYATLHDLPPMLTHVGDQRGVAQRCDAPGRARAAGRSRCAAGGVGGDVARLARLGGGSAGGP